MEKKWMDIKRAIEYPKEGILSKEIISAHTALFCMAAASRISDHASTREGFVYVLEGDGIFKLGGEKIKMEPGVLIHLEKNAVHSLNADKNTSFILVLVDQNLNNRLKW